MRHKSIPIFMGIEYLKEQGTCIKKTFIPFLCVSVCLLYNSIFPLCKDFCVKVCYYIVAVWKRYSPSVYEAVLLLLIGVFLFDVSFPKNPLGRADCAAVYVDESRTSLGPSFNQLLQFEWCWPSPLLSTIITMWLLATIIVSKNAANSSRLFPHVVGVHFLRLWRSWKYQKSFCYSMSCEARFLFPPLFNDKDNIQKKKQKKWDARAQSGAAEQRQTQGDESNQFNNRCDETWDLFRWTYSVPLLSLFRCCTCVAKIARIDRPTRQWLPSISLLVAAALRGDATRWESKCNSLRSLTVGVGYAHTKKMMRFETI